MGDTSPRFAATGMPVAATDEFDAESDCSATNR
jgi:hypothetical protein